MIRRIIGFLNRLLPFVLISGLITFPLSSQNVSQALAAGAQDASSGSLNLLSIAPNAAVPGTLLTLTGTGFSASDNILVRFEKDSCSHPDLVSGCSPKAMPFIVDVPGIVNSGSVTVAAPPFLTGAAKVALVLENGPDQEESNQTLVRLLPLPTSHLRPGLLSELFFGGLRNLAQHAQTAIVGTVVDSADTISALGSLDGDLEDQMSALQNNISTGSLLGFTLTPDQRSKRLSDDMLLGVLNGIATNSAAPNVLRQAARQFYQASTERHAQQASTKFFELLINSFDSLQTAPQSLVSGDSGTRSENLSASSGVTTTEALAIIGVSVAVVGLAGVVAFALAPEIAPLVGVELAPEFLEAAENAFELATTFVSTTSLIGAALVAPADTEVVNQGLLDVITDLGNEGLKLLDPAAGDAFSIYSDAKTLTTTAEDIVSNEPTSTPTPPPPTPTPTSTPVPLSGVTISPNIQTVAGNFATNPGVTFTIANNSSENIHIGQAAIDLIMLGGGTYTITSDSCSNTDLLKGGNQCQVVLTAQPGICSSREEPAELAIQVMGVIDGATATLDGAIECQ